MAPDRPQQTDGAGRQSVGALRAQLALVRARETPPPPPPAHREVGGHGDNFIPALEHPAHFEPQGFAVAELAELEALPTPIHGTRAHAHTTCTKLTPRMHGHARPTASES